MGTISGTVSDRAQMDLVVVPESCQISEQILPSAISEKLTDSDLR